MARKSKENPKTGEVPFGDIKWVLNNLSRTELEDFDNCKVSAAEVTTFVGRLLEVGWSTSIKFDVKSNCHQVSFVQRRFEYPNAGFAFSARSDDWFDALAICWYKYTILAKGVLGEYEVDHDNFRG